MRLIAQLLLPGAAFAQGFGPTPVAVAPIVERDLPATLRLVGSVLADRQALVASEFAGIVAELPVREGQRLRAGDPICKLDPVPAELNLDQAQAQLAAFKATLERWENGEREEDLRRLKGLLDEAIAIQDKWRFELERVRGLTAANQSNTKEVNDAEKEFLAAEARVAQAQAAYDLACNGTRPEEIAKARFDVAAQESVVRQLQRRLEKMVIRAPFDGFIVSRRTEVGDWLDPGGAVCELVAIDTVKVRVDVPESAIPFAQVGAPASVRIEALDEARTAAISRRVPQAAAAARTFPVEIDVANADHAILPGMFVRANVPAGPLGKRLMAPKDAIVAHGIDKLIYVVRSGPDGAKVATPVAVETGLEIDATVEVRAEGLVPGEEVVVRGNERLNPMMPNPVIPMPSATSQVAAQE